MTRMDSILKKLKLLLLPKKRRIYVVLQGKLKGEWLVRIKDDVFFSLPDKYIRNIPEKDFVWGLQNNVIEAVDVLPKLIYNVCLAEYNLKATDEQRNNTLSRWEQHDSPDTLDRE